MDYYLKVVLSLNVFLLLYHINRASKKYPRGYMLVSKKYIRGIFELGYARGRSNGGKAVMEIVEGRGNGSVEFSRSKEEEDLKEFDALIEKQFKEK